MPIINVTKEASDVIRDAAVLPFRETGKPRPDGTVDIPVDDEVLARIKQLAFKGESISDTLIRIVLTTTKPKQ